MTRARGNTHDKLKKHGRPIRNEEDILSRAFAPRQNPLPAPTPAIDDAPYVCLIVNVEWVSHVLGVLETLNQPDAWQGDETEKHRSQNEIQHLLEMLMTGDACMIDPCCPETNEILTEIKVLNQTIVTNQVTIINNQEISIEQNTTIIDNSETVIEQNTEQVINQYFDQSNAYTQNSYDQRTFNLMLYDGTNESVGPNVPEDFDGEGDEDGEGALCAAVDRYQTSALYQQTNNINGVARFVGVSSAALAGLLVAQSLWTAGISAAFGVAVALTGAAFGGAVIAWNNSVNDPEARRKARCCMFDNLKGQAVTFEAFKASMNDCSFEVGTNESNVAAAIHTQNQDHGNYLAFVRALSEAQGTVGSTENCACDIVLVNAQDVVFPFTTITRVPGTNTWHIQNSVLDTTGFGVIGAGIRDVDNRCFDMIANPPEYVAQGVIQSNTFWCDGTSTGVITGGGGGDCVKKYLWDQGGSDPDPVDTYVTVIPSDTEACLE